MKILIISNRIYPAISPRSLRATELAKYFASIGHEVILYAVLGKYDYSNFKKETNVNVKSFGKMNFATLDSDGNSRNTFIDKVFRKLFGKLIEFPDIELSWKTYNVLKQEKDIDLLITIAFPYPIHWGAAFAKNKLKNFPKTWVSDCGDPYMGNTVGKKKPFYFKYIEEFWGKQTDYITIPIEEAKKAYSPNVQSKIRVIPQGFDFTNLKVDRSFKGNDIPHFAYSGVVYTGYRDPTNFLNYLVTLKHDFKFIVYTKSKDIFNIYKPKLKDKLIIKDYIPRDELLFELSRMDFLINFQNASSVQSPSKLIDYYLTERPILNITSEFKEKDDFKKFIHRDYSNALECKDISRYNITNVGNKFLELS